MRLPVRTKSGITSGDGALDLSAPELSGPSGEFVARANSKAVPTETAYGAWQAAFGFFNERLFDGALSDPLITLTRKKNVRGYFCGGAFRDNQGGVAHEISMNPAWFEARGDEGAYSTLAHEMVHLWRHELGKLNRKGGKGAGGYHDTVWADQMETIGLMPSNTGRPGGERTGFAVTHYIIENGRFDVACRELLIAGGGIKYRDARNVHQPQPVERGPARPAARKPRFTLFACTLCDLEAKSRASALLACVSCDAPLVPQRKGR
jgi:hypothetical protein